VTSTRDRALADKINANGGEWGLRIVEEAREEGILVSMGCALVEQESNFKNVWGHDRDSDGDIIWPGRPGDNYVTEDEYREYKRRRKASGNKRMQGCGLTQLTWWEFQDAADHEGGCWVPRYQCRIGFRLLASLIRRYGTRKGLAVYNGGAGNPNYLYADQVLRKQQHWHDVLT
jgi:hypothetical protein